MNRFKINQVLFYVFIFLFCVVTLSMTAQATTDTEVSDSRSMTRAIGSVIIGTGGNTSNENGQTGYYAGDKEEISISFMPTHSGSEPITITVSDGAKINVDPLSPTTLTYTVAGKTANYTNLKVSDDKSTLTFNADGLVKNRIVKITIEIITPENATAFSINAKVGTISAPSLTYQMLSSIVIAVPSSIRDTTLFTISGNVRKLSSLSMGTVLLKIRDNYGNSVIERQAQYYSDGSYTFNQLSLRGWTGGNYTAEVTLCDSSLYQGKAVQSFYMENAVTITPTYYNLYTRNGYSARGVNPVGFHSIVTNYNYVPLSGYELTAEVTLNNISDIAGARYLYDTGFGTYIYNAVLSGNILKANLTNYRINRMANLTLEITRTDGSTETFWVGYINFVHDPAGYIYDIDTGERIAGAVATLYYRHSFITNNEWELWQEDLGQINPIITGADGTFSWLVSPGEYEVRVYHPDYHNEGEYYSTFHDPQYGVIVVPPEKLDVFIGLKKLNAVNRSVQSILEDTFVEFIPAEE